MTYATPKLNMLSQVHAAVPPHLREYVAHAGESSDFYLEPPYGAPVELRYHGASLAAIVPDVGMADGLPCWVWSSTSRRMTLTRHTLTVWRLLLALASLRYIEHATLMQYCQVEQERQDATTSYSKGAQT